jgi:branched-chain amino acid transport system permease protein
MSSLLQDLPLPLIVGLAVGSFYALIALCFHLVFASAGAVNFAQGQFFMYGALIYASLAGPLPAIPALAVGAVILMAGSALFAVLIFQPLNRPNVPHLALVLAPIAAGGALDALALLIWGNEGSSAPPLLPDHPINVGSAAIVPQHLIIIAATWAVLLIFWLCWRKPSLA